MNRSLAALAIPLASLGLLAFSCEPPRSKNPLGDPAHAVADARLTGVWAGRTNDNSRVTLTFDPRANGLVDLVLIGDDDTKGAIVIAFEGLSINVQKKSYWSLRAKSYGDDWAGTVKVSDDYIFARYEVSKSGALSVAILDEDRAAAAVKSGALEGTAVEGKPLQLTASSEQLAAFFSSPQGEQSFRPIGVFKQGKLNYPARHQESAP